MIESNATIKHAFSSKYEHPFSLNYEQALMWYLQEEIKEYKSIRVTQNVIVFA